MATNMTENQPIFLFSNANKNVAFHVFKHEEYNEIGGSL